MTPRLGMDGYGYMPNFKGIFNSLFLASTSLLSPLLFLRLPPPKPIIWVTEALGSLFRALFYSPPDHREFWLFGERNKTTCCKQKISKPLVMTPLGCDKFSHNAISFRMFKIMNKTCPQFVNRKYTAIQQSRSQPGALERCPKWASHGFFPCCSAKTFRKTVWPLGSSNKHSGKNSWLRNFYSPHHDPRVAIAPNWNVGYLEQ